MPKARGIKQYLESKISIENKKSRNPGNLTVKTENVIMSPKMEEITSPKLDEIILSPKLVENKINQKTSVKNLTQRKKRVRKLLTSTLIATDKSTRFSNE